MVNQSAKDISKIFNIAKAFAILSVIIAHTDFNIENAMILSPIKRLGSIGVIVFLVISAYYFKPEKYENILIFFKSKLITLFIPWLICGSLVFFYSNIKMHVGFTFIDYLFFLIGKGSYLYYLTVLIFCYIIFFYIVKNKIRLLLYVFIFLNILSLVLTSFGLIDISKLGLTDYLNIFNWIGYFSIGIILKYLNLNKIFAFIKKYSFVFILAWGLIVFIGIYIDKDKAGYFSKLGFIAQLLGAVLLLYVANHKIYENKFIKKISEYSFSIYLLHFLIIPVVFKFMGFSIYTSILMPLATLAVTILLIYIGEKISKLVKLEKLYKIVLGIR